MKNKNKVPILIIIILLLIVTVAIVMVSKKLITNNADDFITVRLYDSNKQLIDSVGTQSIVQGVTGVNYIDLTITATNTGTEPLTCEIISLSPTAFDNAVTKTEKTVPSTSPKKASWTSNLIDVTPLESGSPVTFSATLRCTYNPGTGVVTLSDKVGSINLVITAEAGSAGFEVGVDYGGTPTEFCGDGTCQADEDSSSCPEDCATSANVRFRTTDLSYVSGTGVGYTTTCGNTLTAFGKTTGACTEHLCDEVNQQLNIPSASGTTKFWYRDANTVCICDDGQTSGYSKRYSTSDSDASKVDTSPLSFDSDKELSC